jgi:hypothetical protein
MKKSEWYKNQYPLEDILPELNEKEVEQIVSNCDYRIEADKIVAADNFGEISCVNTADAVVFYKMGYEAAIERIEKVLKPIN